MGDIYRKAQQEQAKGFYQELLDKLEGFHTESADRRSKGNREVLDEKQAPGVINRSSILAADCPVESHNRCHDAIYLLC